MHGGTCRGHLYWFPQMISHWLLRSSYVVRADVLMSYTPLWRNTS